MAMRPGGPCHACRTIRARGSAVGGALVICALDKGPQSRHPYPAKVCSSHATAAAAFPRCTSAPPRSHRGHGGLEPRHLPLIIPRARLCALMPACQPSPPRLESHHDELQFGVSPVAVPFRPGSAVVEGSHPTHHFTPIQLHPNLHLHLHFTLRPSCAPLLPRRSC